jgi:hypothetical protein
MTENQPAIIQLHGRGKPAHAEKNGDVKLIARAKIKRRAPVAGLAVADNLARDKAGTAGDQTLYIHPSVNGLLRAPGRLGHIGADSLTVSALVDACAQNAEFFGRPRTGAGVISHHATFLAKLG